MFAIADLSRYYFGPALAREASTPIAPRPRPSAKNKHVTFQYNSPMSKLRGLGIPACEQASPSTHTAVQRVLMSSPFARNFQVTLHLIFTDLCDDYLKGNRIGSPAELHQFIGTPVS